MIRIGTLDRVTSIFGERGTGKSTLAKLDAEEFRRETGGWVVGHSPNGQIGYAGPATIEFHDSIRALDDALRKRPANHHYLASGGSPEQVIDYARALSLVEREQAHKRIKAKFHPHRPPNPSALATPILVVVDEGTHAKAHNKGYGGRVVRDRQEAERALGVETKEELEKFLTGARHENVALTFLIQEPTARGWIYASQTNRLRCFRYEHQWGLNAVRAAGAPQEAIERIQSLPDFEYFSKDKRAPENAGFRKLPPPE